MGIVGDYKNRYNFRVIMTGDMSSVYDFLTLYDQQ